MRHNFGSVDAAKFKASTDASGRRNAGLRRLRSQAGVKPTPVNFDEQMSAKFLEIWTSGASQPKHWSEDADMVSQSAIRI